MSGNLFGFLLIIFVLLFEYRFFYFIVFFIFIFFIISKEYRKAFVIPIVISFFIGTMYFCLLVTNAKDNIKYIIPECIIEKVFQDESIDDFYHESMECIENEEYRIKWLNCPKARQIIRDDYYVLSFVTERKEIGSVYCAKNGIISSKKLNPLSVLIKDKIIVSGDTRKLDFFTFPKKLLCMYSIFSILFIIFVLFLVFFKNADIFRNNLFFLIIFLSTLIFSFVFVKHTSPGFFINSNNKIYNIAKTRLNSDIYNFFSCNEFSIISLNPYTYIYYSKNKDDISINPENIISCISNNICIVEYKKYLFKSNFSTLILWSNFIGQSLASIIFIISLFNDVNIFLFFSHKRIQEKR